MGRKSTFYVDIMDIHDKVTGSCHLCVVKDQYGENMKFIVDCGMFQEEGGDELNKKIPFNASEVAFCLVTHNHIDHTGRLPFLVQNGFSGNIYATETTCNLLPEALKDSCSIIKSRAKSTGTKPLYSDEDLEKTLSLCKPCAYDSTIHINDHVKVNFFQNAHLPGAAIILVRITSQGNDDINILFTGDYNNKNVFLNDVCIPEWVLELPITIVQESTYGDTDSSEIETCFNDNIIKAVKKEWTIIVPVFSLGRAQEILYRLKQLQEAGEIDKEIPIYLDGKLAIRYTNMYLDGLAGIRKDMLDFLPENLTYVDKILRKTLLSNEDNSCKIILASSGMGSYGPARSYIPAYLGNKKALIHFAGYTAVNTMGRRIKDAPYEEIVNVGGLLIKKRATVEYTSEFSAHARANIIIKFLKQFLKVQLIILNHGEPLVKEQLAPRILNEVSAKHVGILSRETLFRIDHFGFVKTIPTKFI